MKNVVVAMRSGVPRTTRPQRRRDRHRGAGGSGHQLRLTERAGVLDLGQQPRDVVRLVRLGELDHGAVRLAWLEERLLPVRVAEVDADGVQTGGAAAVEHRLDVGHLERDVVGRRPEAVDEALEEVVDLRSPHDERLDRHARPRGADAHLHPPEAVAVAAVEDGAAESPTSAANAASSRRSRPRRGRDRCACRSRRADDGAAARCPRSGGAGATGPGEEPGAHVADAEDDEAADRVEEVVVGR